LSFHRARYLVSGWLLFVTTLIPVIGIVQVGSQAMADRYTYVPCIGLFVIIAWGLGAMVDAFPIAQFVAPVTAVCVILALAATTTQYLQYWQNGVKLFTHTRIVVGRPDGAIEEDLADETYSAGHIDEAFAHYREACILRPNYATCHYNMAEILFDRHQFQDALEQYQLAVSYTNSKDMAVSGLINSGKILLKLGDYRTAEMRFAAALEVDPGNSVASSLYQQVPRQVGQ
jgi:hypothetical protein